MIPAPTEIVNIDGKQINTGKREVDSDMAAFGVGFAMGFVLAATLGLIAFSLYLGHF
jgi:hypothetical protein